MPWYTRWRTLVPFLALLITAPSYSQSGGAADQQSSSPQQGAAVSPSNNVLRSTTRLVVVDVVTVDSKGEPVPDLKADDFTILEDGKPQKISGFNFKQGDRTAQAVGAATGSGFTNAPQYKDANSLNVILLDAINGNFASYAYGRDELLKFLKKGTLTQPTALYVLEQKLTLLHDFTTDITQLQALVQDYKPKGPVHIQDVYSAASPFSARAPSNSTTVNTMEVSVTALNSLARALAGYPGRKNLIWVSAGFPVTLFPEIIYDEADPFCRPACGNPNDLTMAQNPSFGRGSGKDFQAEIEKVANALMNAQVAVYPIDESGLQKDNHLNTINTMRALAERTGGKAFYNRNDVEVGIRTSIEDGSTYYTLEYYPTNNTWDGKFRLIQIKSKSGVNLRYRQGYYALDPGAKDKDADKTLIKNFSDALNLDTPSATAVVFHAGITPPSEKAQKVTVSFAIDPHTISFEHKSDGLEYALVSCAVAVFSDKGTPVKREMTTMTAAMKADEFEKMMKGQQFPCKRTIDLKPGSYNLTLGVVDRNSRLMGTTTAWVKVP
jgi:VWFA-related protein